MPNAQGEHGKIAITLKNDSVATADFFLYDKDNKVLLGEKWDLKVEKDADGDIILTEAGDEVAYIWEDYDMDFYGYPGFRFSAKKK